MPDQTHPVQLCASNCANGETVEWYLTVAGRRVPDPGVFVDGRKSPAEMLPEVLARIASKREADINNA